MITITVDNSYSNISGLTATQFAALKKELSYQTDLNAAYHGGFGPKTHYLIDRKGNFPTGLLSRVYRQFDANSRVEIRDNRKKPAQPTNTKALKVAYYPPQETAIIMSMICNRGTISMPTGSGKSLVIAGLIKTYSLKTLVVVPNLELKLQLEADLKSHGLKCTVLNIDSPKLQTATDYDMLIIDEAHHVAAKTYQNLNKKAWKGIYNRFMLTATPFRNQANEQLLFEAIAGEVIYQLTYKQAIDQGIIVPVEAYTLEIPKQATDAYTWSQVYSSLVVNNDYRNAKLAELMLALDSDGKSTLTLVKEIKHGKLLSDLTGVPFANGQDEESRKQIQLFNQGKIKSLIGTTGILGEGCDTKPCEFVIIACLGKAKSALMQQIGRGVRKYPGKESCKVILVKDTSHKFTIRHYNVQKKILAEEYGVDVLKLDI